MSDVKVFIDVAIKGHWLPFMTGIGSLVVSAVTFTRKAHWAARIFLVLSIFSGFYGSYSAWRDEHRQKLEATKELTDRINNVHPQDPAFENLGGVIAAFTAMREMYPSNKCIILITDPNGDNSSVHQTLLFGASLAGCISGGFNGIGPSEGPEAREAAVKDYSPDHVVIHSAKDDNAAFVLFDKLSTLTFVRQSWSFLPWVPDGVVWIQVGRNVQWYRH